MAWLKSSTILIEKNHAFIISKDLIPIPKSSHHPQTKSKEKKIEEIKKENTTKTISHRRYHIYFQMLANQSINAIIQHFKTVYGLWVSTTCKVFQDTSNRNSNHIIIAIAIVVTVIAVIISVIGFGRRQWHQTTHSIVNEQHIQ